MPFLLMILGSIWMAQAVLAITCLKRFPAARIPAIVLLAVAPLPVVAALGGQWFLRQFHVASSRLLRGAHIVLRHLCGNAQANVEQ